MNPAKKFASVFNSRTPNNQNIKKNSIATDFLRRGNTKTKIDIQTDQKFNEDLTIQGWMNAALTVRADSFAEFCEDNIITESNSDISKYHLYLQLIENSTTVSEFEFWRDAISDYDIYGEVFFFMLRRVVYEDEHTYVNGKLKKPKVTHIGLPTAIEIIDAKNMKVLKNSLGEIVGYRERIDSTHKREFLPEQIVHVMNHHPLDKKKPYSIYEAAKAYQYTINKGTEFAQSALINNMNTPGILSTAEILNDDEYDNLISRINSHEPGKAIVTDGTGNLTYTPITQSIDSASLPSLTEISRQTIFAVTGTSKTILGIEESGVTRETSRVQDKKFIKRTIAPIARRIISALNFDFRVNYTETYKNDAVRLAIKSIYDPIETQERFETQKTLFDDITEIIYSGYTKESAEDFMNGDISFSDLELDAEDAQDIDEEQEDIEEDADSENTSQKSPEDTRETGDEQKGNITESSLRKIDLENQQSEMHNHTNSDDFHLKALKLHMNEKGELDEYGQMVEKKILKAKKNLLNEIRSAQMEAIRTADTRLAVNAFDYKDIRTEEQEQSVFDKIFNALKKYWLVLLPLIGKERLAEDELTTGLKEQVNLLGTKSVKDYIVEASQKAAESHTNTIYHTILESANKAEDKIFKSEFAKEYLSNFKQGEDKWFKTKPTTRQITSKLGNENFVKDNNELYESVRKKIAEGYNRNEIQQAIRKEYINLSRTRANTLVGNEMARAINNSQFIADYELLKKAGMMKNAYKRLVSHTGDPCPICQALIDKGDIPFENSFLKLGDTVQVENGEKTTTFTCNYENIDSGVVHVNCHCGYELIIKGEQTNE